MARALAKAEQFAAAREAFGARLADLPLHAETLRTMRCRRGKRELPRGVCTQFPPGAARCASRASDQFASTLNQDGIPVRFSKPKVRLPSMNWQAANQGMP